LADLSWIVEGFGRFVVILGGFGMGFVVICGLNRGVGVVFWWFFCGALLAFCGAGCFFTLPLGGQVVGRGEGLCFQLVGLIILGNLLFLLGLLGKFLLGKELTGPPSLFL